MPTSSMDTLLVAAREAARLEELHGLDVLDTPPEQAFDDLAALAAQLCNAPIALVSLVDTDRQWFKARCGLDASETHRDVAFCAHAIEQPGIFEVPDATLDPRFADNPLVTGPPDVRFYAGAPLVGRHDFRYGTLCVIDTMPRTLTDAQRDGLQRLARCASEALETRRVQRRSKARESTLARLLEAMPDAVVTCDATGLLGEFNRAARDWHGIDPRALPPEEWAEHFDLFQPDGATRLPTDEIPLLRAQRGERVRNAAIVIRAAGQPPRIVECSGEPLRGADGTPLGAVCVMHDVTQLRQAEAAARLEGERFADAFAAAAQGMALVSPAGRWLEVNDALCEMFGYARAELLELDVQDITHPEDLRSGIDLNAAVLAGGRMRHHLEKRYIHKSGRVIHAHLSLSLVRDEAGAPLHFVAQVQDFTHRYRAETRLRESEQKFRAVLERTHDAFVAADDAGDIIEWNHAAEVAFGWRREEVLGLPLDQVIIPPRMRAAHRAGMARFVQTGESHVLDQRLQLPAWHRAGHEFPVEMTISRVHLGNRQVFSAFMHDISARLRVKEALKASVAQLRTIADNVPALIAHVGADLRFQFVNRAYADWFGGEASALVGRHMAEVLRPEHFEDVKPRLDTVLSGLTVEFDADVRDFHGELRHMRATYVPEPREDGGTERPASFHLMMHDQTAQVRLSRMLAAQALKDDLTDLPNRAAWNDELARAIARAHRTGKPLAVMFVDLDGFKGINDHHGHAAGDHVLREFAALLRRTLRAGDFIARLAGDEFVVLLDHVSDLDRDPPRVAEKIGGALAQGIAFEGRVLPVRASIGMGVQPGPYYDGDALVRCADEAMYAAKRDRSTQLQVRICTTPAPAAVLA